jgi:hypothetical protein
MNILIVFLHCFLYCKMIIIKNVKIKSFMKKEISNKFFISISIVILCMICACDYNKLDTRRTKVAMIAAGII